ncbi:hypothetical protein, partial [Mycobacterium avium]|uniref:hypothetical protein n=1 Tax=Mycobacterium avium TaxID=1764 RepID=UPI001C300E06
APATRRIHVGIYNSPLCDFVIERRLHGNRFAPEPEYEMREFVDQQISILGSVRAVPPGEPPRMY